MRVTVFHYKWLCGRWFYSVCVNVNDVDKMIMFVAQLCCHNTVNVCVPNVLLIHAYGQRCCKREIVLCIEQVLE